MQTVTTTELVIQRNSSMLTSMSSNRACVCGGASDRDSGCSGSEAVGEIGGIDAADRDHRDGHGFTDRPQPVKPDRGLGVGLRRRRPHRAGADVGGADSLTGDRLFDARRRQAEHQSGLDRGLGSFVGAAQMHTVGTELDGGLTVVVHDEGDAVERAEVTKRPAFVHDLLGGFALQAQLENGRASFDGALRRLEVTD